MPATLAYPTAPNPLLVAADIIDPPQWEAVGRPELEAHQLPPAGPFDLWILEAGRGAGKTEACARYFTKHMRANPGFRGRIIAPTFGDAVEACVVGPSGLKSVDPDGVEWLPSAPGGSKVVWANGSEALVLGTYTPRDVDRLRAGGNRHIDWWEEMAANPQLGDPLDPQGAWNQAQLGLRMGEHPHSIASTTPRATKAYRAVRKLATKLTKATMFDNPHLPKWFIDKMKKRYEGTRLGRQELYGELLEDVVGALWQRDRLDLSRVQLDQVPDLAVVATAVDPAATATETSDDTGIVVAALGVNGHGYVLADRTCHLSPQGWGARAVGAHRDHRGDYIVGEINNGGEMVEHVIKTVPGGSNVPYRPVRASRGKATRAQPVAALWGEGNQQPACHIVGSLPELEDQLTTWVPGEEDSPDRLDAMVWALTELMLAEDDEVDTYEYYEPVTIGPQV